MSGLGARQAIWEWQIHEHETLFGAPNVLTCACLGGLQIVQ